MKQDVLPMRIAIIDDEIETKTLQELTPYYTKSISVIKCGGTRYSKNSNVLVPPVNHGTLCTALLIEALYERNILDKTEIVNITIGNEAGKNDLLSLTQALRYCMCQRFDIVSMSLGVYHLLYAKQMIPLLHQIQNKTVIVAAAANDFKLAYPAAFPSVIGVKRSCQAENKRVKVLQNPVDGIEVVMTYLETPVLSSITKKYRLNYEDSNSILVPQICAEIALQIVQNKVWLNKDQLLKMLGEPSVTEEAIEVTAKHLLVKNCEDSIPILLFQYSTVDHNNVYILCKKLQLEFEMQGYSCAILCDFLSQADFESGWYKLDDQNANDCIQYYQKATSDSVVFVLQNKEKVTYTTSDLVIDCDELRCNIEEMDFVDMAARLINSM